MKEHHYRANIKWTGNLGSGTSGYKDFSRDHIISIPGKHDILSSSDPSFRGDPTRHNPEEMLVSSLSTCHMLWFLHLCSTKGIVVVDYEDNPTGIMEEGKHGEGQFTNVTLYPEVTVHGNANSELVHSLHIKANELCFIARSVNFPVLHSPKLISKT